MIFYRRGVSNEIELFGGPKDGLRFDLGGVLCPPWITTGVPYTEPGADTYVLRPVQSRHGVTAYDWQGAER